MFKNPFSHIGRIRRLEYGLSCLIYLACNVGIMVLVFENENFELLILLHIPLFWCLIAQGSKRCHDMGNASWYQFIPLYFFVMLFSDGQEGKNEYGLNLKEIGNESEIDNIGKEDLE